MSSSNEEFYAMLFNEGEHVCFSPDPKGTRVMDNESLLGRQMQYLCINPLDGQRDRCPSEEYHSPNRPRRADGNVTDYRNFLIEIDHADYAGDFRKQRDLIESVKTPWSTCVYSGNKSLHYVICLEEGVSRQDYEALARRIHRIRRFIGVIDPATKNASRLSRTPDGINSKTGNQQRVVAIRKRVSLRELLDWLQFNGSMPEVPFDPSKMERKLEGTPVEMFKVCVERVESGKRKTGRVAPLEWTDGNKHAYLVSLAAMCKGVGISYDDAVSMAVENGYISGKKTQEIFTKMYKR